jgi:hypothetical protein
MFLKTKASPGVFIEEEMGLHDYSPTLVEKDFYYNLALVRSISLGQVEEPRFKGKQWVALKGCSYITFSGITVDYQAPVSLTLIFNQDAQGEYHRTIRVIEGDKA